MVDNKDPFALDIKRVGNTLLRNATAKDLETSPAFTHKTGYQPTEAGVTPIFTYKTGRSE